jgi:hypothetical protein
MRPANSGDSIRHKKITMPIRQAVYSLRKKLSIYGWDINTIDMTGYRLVKIARNLQGWIKHHKGEERTQQQQKHAVNFEISWEDFRSFSGRFGLFDVAIQCRADTPNVQISSHEVSKFTTWHTLRLLTISFYFSYFSDI